MPTLKIPFFGSYNRREFNTSNLDQRVIGGIFNVVKNPLTNSVSPYLEKRCGLKSLFTAQGGSGGAIPYVSPGTLGIYSAFANPSTLYESTTALGTITGAIVHITECISNSVVTLLITSNDGTGWYYPTDASGVSATFAGTTHSNTTMDGITSTAKYYVGQLLTGSGLSAGTRIATIIDANSITMTIAAGSGVTATFTHEYVAKQISANFPTGIVGPFAEMDGYVFIMTATARVYNSDLNTVATWSSASYIPANIYTDAGQGLFKRTNYIGAFGTSSVEFFYNAGNPTGSPLSAAPQLAKALGAAVISGAFRKPFASFEDNVYWVGTGGDLYRFDGFTPVKLSNIGVLSSLNSVSQLLPYGFDVFRLNGSLIVNVSSNVANKSRWHFPDQGGIWAEPGFTDAVFISSYGSSAYAVISGTDTSGKVYQLDGTTFLDNGAAFTMTTQIQTDMETNLRKFVSELRVDCDVQASGNLGVSYSDDDGATFSTPRNISMTSTRMRLPRLGSFVGKRLWKFTHSDNTAWRGRRVEIDYTIGNR